MSDSFDIIGLDAEETNQPVNFHMRGQEVGITFGVVISSPARDSGSTPTTFLRAGLVLGRVTASGLWKEYDDADADGTEVARAILAKDTDLLNAAGTAVNVSSLAHTGGFYDEDKLIGIDTNGKADLKALHVTFKEDIYP